MNATAARIAHHTLNILAAVWALLAVYDAIGGSATSTLFDLAVLVGLCKLRGPLTRAVAAADGAQELRQIAAPALAAVAAAAERIAAPRARHTRD